MPADRMKMAVARWRTAEGLRALAKRTGIISPNHFGRLQRLHLLADVRKKLRSRIPTLWTNSYFVATTGGAPLSLIKQYIENQKNV